RGLARLYWSGAARGQGYDVTSGNVASLRVEGDHISLGAVRVAARLLTGTAGTEGDALPTGDATVALPAAGQGFFYLVQYRDAHGMSGFGTESASLPSEPASCAGGCPAAEAQ